VNRQQRRAQAARGEHFVASCAMCESEHCDIHVVRRFGKKDLGICKGCPCAAGTCDSCGHTGEHWLGCSAVGLPEGPAAGAVMQ